VLAGADLGTPAQRFFDPATAIAAASAGGALDALPKRERSEPLPDRRPTPGPPDEGDDG
jgi:hypothetical protein